jgi:hypothetical protein
MTVDIDSVKISNANIDFRELVPLEEELGILYLRFTGVNGVGTNICNDSSKLDDQSEFVLNGGGTFMGKSKAEVQLTTPILSENDFFTCNASIVSLPLSAIDTITRQLMNVHLEDGRINKLDADFTGDISGSNGSLIFDYSDLKIKAFKEKDGKRKGKWLLNLAANAIIPANNNVGEGSFKEGNIEYQRSDDISIFAYVWQSLKSGIMDTVAPL